MIKKNMSETEQKIVENLLDEMYKSFDLVYGKDGKCFFNYKTHY